MFNYYMNRDRNLLIHSVLPVIFLLLCFKCYGVHLSSKDTYLLNKAQLNYFCLYVYKPVIFLMLLAAAQQTTYAFVFHIFFLQNGASIFYCLALLVKTEYIGLWFPVTLEYLYETTHTKLDEIMCCDGRELKSYSH